MSPSSTLTVRENNPSKHANEMETAQKRSVYVTLLSECNGKVNILAELRATNSFQILSAELISGYEAIEHMCVQS